jgi:hypothetical protein
LSRKKSAPAKKAAPIKLAWVGQIIRHEWPDKPRKTSIIATAAVLAEYASLDGRDCFPTINTVAREVGIKPATVIDCIKAMRKAGLLEASGKASTGANRYTLRLVAVPDETHPDTEQIAPSVAPSVAPRGTQPPTLDRKGEGGGDAPGADAPAARVAGLNIGATETIKPLVTIDGEHADQLVTEFIADFEPAYAKRSKNANGRNLEPSHRALRTGIITKLDAGWPCDHLIDRIIADLPDDRKINTLTGIVAHKLSELPNAPDATALAHTIAAEAKRRIDDAERKTEQTAETESIDREARFRRKQAINAYRRAVAKYRPAIDADKATREMVQSLDAEGQDDDDPAAWPLSPLWVEWMHNEIDELRQEHQARQAPSEHETTAQAPTVTQGGSW